MRGSRDARRRGVALITLTLGALARGRALLQQQDLTAQRVALSLKSCRTQIGRACVSAGAREVRLRALQRREERRVPRIERRGVGTQARARGRRRVL